MSTFSCPIVQIGKVQKHPNADTLWMTEVEGALCLFREGQFKEGDRAIFVPIDAVVPLNSPQFSFLAPKDGSNKKTHRIKARRLRGVFSDGLLIETGSLTGELGQDMSEQLGVSKYEEPVPLMMGGENETDPGFMPVYDIEPLKKYRHLMIEGESVVITEKLHGTSFRCGWYKGEFYVGSHRTVKRYNEDNLYWKVANLYGLKEKLKPLKEGLVVYGEVYGDVQDLKYGSKPGQYFFAAFDIYDSNNNKYLDFHNFEALCYSVQIPIVPVLYTGPYTFEKVSELTDNDKPLKSVFNDNCIREGVVVKPTIERKNLTTRRTIFKHVSQAYLLRKGGTELH